VRSGWLAGGKLADGQSGGQVQEKAMAGHRGADSDGPRSGDPADRFGRPR